MQLKIKLWDQTKSYATQLPDYSLGQKVLPRNIFLKKNFHKFLLASCRALALLSSLLFTLPPPIWPVIAVFRPVWDRSRAETAEFETCFKMGKIWGLSGLNKIRDLLKIFITR